MDIDAILNGGYNPLMGMMDPTMQKQFKDTQTFDTVLGLLGGYKNSLYKGQNTTGKIFDTLVGGYTNRQNTVNRFANLMKAQTEILKNKADLTKTQLDVFNTQNKIRAAYDIANQTNDPFLKRALQIDPEGIANNMFESRFAKMPKLSGDDMFLARSMGYDLNNLTPDQARNLMEVREGQTSREKIQSNLDIANLAKDYPGLANAIGTPQTKTELLNNMLTNQANNQNMTGGPQGGYMPSAEFNIPEISLSKVKNGETMTVPGYFYGPQDGAQQPTGSNQVNQQVNQQPVNQTEQYNNIQNFTNKLQDLDRKVETQTGIVPKNYKYTPSQIKEYADNREDFTAKSIRTVDDFNDSLRTIDQLLNHAGFDKYFSAGGAIQGFTNREAIEAKRLFNNLTSEGTAQKLVNMKLEDKNGATPFGQLNYSELKLVQDSFSKVENSGGSPEAARRALNELKQDILRARGYIMDKHNTIYDGYRSDKFANPYIYDMKSPNGMPVYLGSVAKGKFFGQFENLDDDTYYIQKPNGTMVAVPNKKNGGNLNRIDFLQGNY